MPTSAPAALPIAASPVVPSTPIREVPKLPGLPEKLLTAHTETPKHKTSWGPLIGIVIIVLVLIVGALYFWGARLAEQDATSSLFQEESAELDAALESAEAGFEMDAEATE